MTKVKLERNSQPEKMSHAKRIRDSDRRVGAFAVVSTPARIAAKFKDDKADKADAEMKKLAGLGGRTPRSAGGHSHKRVKP